jgi:hypothetical protein
MAPSSIAGMSADDLAALIAAVVSSLGAVVALVVALVLTRRVKELRALTRALGSEAIPLVRDARVVMDQAATEMERVGDVLSSAEAVSGTVDSASRLAYRIFANPVVKVLAFGTGAGSAVRRLFSRQSSHRRAKGRVPATDTARGDSSGMSPPPPAPVHRSRRESRARRVRQAKAAR